MPSFGQLFVSIGANIEGLSKGFDESEKSIKGFGRSLNKLGANFTDIGTKLTLGVTAPLVAFGTVSVAAFSKFDAAMTESLAIMGDVSDELKAGMATAAREMAKTTTFSAEQAAQSFFFLASAGLDAKSSIEALPVVAKFAQAGMFDMAMATDLLTDAQSALGLTIRDDAVANMENMGRVADVLVKANVLANASVQQFSEALTNKAGPAIRAVGKDVEEGVAVLAAFADQGIKGEEAGTQFSIVLRDLQTQALANKENFAALGVSVFDSSGEMRNLGEIVANLEGLLGGMSDESKRAALEQLGFSDRSVAATQALLGTSDAIKMYETQLRSASGITEEVASRQLTSFSAQVSLIRSRIEDTAIEIGTALVPVIRNLGTVLEPVLEFLEDAVRWFGQLPSGIQTTAIVVAGFAAAIGPALIALGTLASSVAGLVPLFTAGGPLAGALAGFGGVLAAITGPVGIAVAVIAGLGVAVYAFRDDIANSRIGEIWSETWESVSASLSAAFDGLTTALSNFTAAFVARWEEGLFGLRPVIEGVWNGIGAIFVGALETISAIVSGGLEVVTGTINVFAQLLAGNFEGAWEAAKGVFRSALGTLVEIVGAQVGAILGIIDGFASALGKNLKLQEVFDKEVAGVLKALDKQTTAIKAAEKPVDDLTKSAKDYGKEAGKIEKPTKDAATAFKGLGAEAKAVKEKLDDLPQPMRFVLRAQEDLEQKTDKNREAWERLADDVLGPLPRKLGTLELAMDDVAAAANRQITDFNNLTGALVSHQLVMSDSELASLRLGDAYTALGVKSQAVADRELKALRDALEEIRKQAAEGNPDALAKLSEAEKAYADRVKGSGGPIEATGLFKGALQSVSTAITDLGKDVAERFAEKIKTGIGIIDDFSEALIRLASEQVLGLVLSKVGDLLGAIPGLRQLSDLLFGGAASGAAGAAGGAAGSAGQAAGGAAQTGGQAIGGTLGGIVSLASAVTTAITGIVSIFQNARQETTLNAIEENTRRGTLFLGDRGDQGILGTQFRIAENSDYITGNTDEMKVSLWDIRGILQGFAASGILVAGLSAVPQVAAKAPIANLAGTTQPLELASAVGRAIDLSELRMEFEAAQQVANNQLDALHEQTAQLEAIQDAIEAQQPSIVINIQNVNGTDNRAVEAFMKEVERRLRTTTRGIR